MPASKKVSLETQALIVLVCGIVYFYAYKLNTFFFEWSEFTHGVNWLYLPSGLRLLFVLVLTHTGALGVVLGTTAINYAFGSSDNSHAYNLLTAVVSGGSPYLARFIAIHFFQLNTQLEGLTARSFFKISILFALTSALLHQVWFFWNGKTEHIITNTFVMAVGDWFGTVLVLAFASLIVQTIKSFSQIKH
jgi:hypothetical protein